MLSGKLFIICGLSRLSARVALSLEEAGGRVTVIVYDGDKPSLRQILPKSATIFTATAENAASVLREAGIADAECLLALSEDDVANVRSTVSARSIVPDVPVVMRAFDPLLADQFEKGFGVRRAFSVSALAAPAFAAAAAGGDILANLRLGSEVVPTCRLTLKKDSPVTGRTPDELERDHDINIIATKRSGEGWQARHPGGLHDEPDRETEKRQQSVGGRHAFRIGAVVALEANPSHLRPGDEILFAGTGQKALTFLIHAAGWYHRQARSGESFGRGSAPGKQKRKVAGARRSFTWMPRLILLLLCFAAFAVTIFAGALHLPFVDAIFFVITSMTTVGDGDVSLKSVPDWLKLFYCLMLLDGGALLGVSFSFLASIATAERLEVTMARQASKMTGHVIVVGLGNVGYRVTSTLTDLGLDMAVIDLSPPARFFDVLSRRAPVLVGDARLSDNLDRLSIREAEAIIACTSDDVANIETCLHARRMNPKIRAVARVFDDQIVGTVAKAFNIDRVLSATNIAKSSFVIAAADETAMRTIELEGLTFSAVRYRARVRIVANDVIAWRNHGIFVLAYRGESGVVTPTLAEDRTHEVIVCGSEAVLRELLAHKLGMGGVDSGGVEAAAVAQR